MVNATSMNSNSMNPLDSSTSSSPAEKTTTNDTSLEKKEEPKEKTDVKIKSFVNGLFNIMKSEKAGVAVLAGGLGMLALGGAAVLGGVLTASAPLWVIGAVAVSAIALPILTSTAIYYFARDKTIVPPEVPIPPEFKTKPKPAPTPDDIKPQPVPPDDIKSSSEPLGTPEPLENTEDLKASHFKNLEDLAEEKFEPTHLEEINPNLKLSKLKESVEEEEIEIQIEEADKLAETLKKDAEKENIEQLNVSVKNLENALNQLNNVLSDVRKEEIEEQDKHFRKNGTTVEFFDPFGGLLNKRNIDDQTESPTKNAPKTRRPAPIRDKKNENI